MLPSKRESGIFIACLVIWLAVTALFVGFRTEHLYIALFLAFMLFVSGTTRRLIVALMPFIIFGIPSADTILTPNEWWALHTHSFLDFLAGCFYLCWVPVPVLFGVWLYFDRQYSVYLHFSIVFLLVNLIGFAGYYIHPASPPWYVAMHGFDFIPGTHGETAGLGRWDAMMGVSIFDGLYSRNSNVFAALPSLHAAYMLIAFIYSLRARCTVWLRVLFAFICLGIWFTAVYTSHHYIIDVLAGIGVTILGWLLFEQVFMRIPSFRRFMSSYQNYISR